MNIPLKTNIWKDVCEIQQKFLVFVFDIENKLVYNNWTNGTHLIIELMNLRIKCNAIDLNYYPIL